MAKFDKKLKEKINKKILNQNNIPAYTLLEDEIKMEEESRKLNKDNIKNFKSNQKPKKNLKKKILGWTLGLGVIAGGLFVYNNNFSENARYNKEIQTRFEEVDKTLTRKMVHETSYNNIDGQKQIDALYFTENEKDEKILEIYYSGENKNFDHKDFRYYYGNATYKVLQNYYDNLVEAESSNNMIEYLDALNDVFNTMEYQNSSWDWRCNMISTAFTDSDISLINDLLKLDFNKSGIEQQVAFLPYNIEVVKWDVDEINNKVDYTYKLHGISYCETECVNSDKIKNDEKIIITENNYDVNHIKSYFRDIELSSSIEYPDIIPDQANRMVGDFYMLFDGLKTTDDFTVKTTYFDETSIFDDYLNMKQTGEFSYEK